MANDTLEPALEAARIAFNAVLHDGMKPLEDFADFDRRCLAPAIAAYLAAASPQAEIDRLREALRAARDNLVNIQRSGNISRAVLAENGLIAIDAILHPETPNGGR